MIKLFQIIFIVTSKFVVFQETAHLLCVSEAWEYCSPVFLKFERLQTSKNSSMGQLVWKTKHHKAPRWSLSANSLWLQNANSINEISQYSSVTRSKVPIPFKNDHKNTQILKNFLEISQFPPTVLSVECHLRNTELSFSYNANAVQSMYKQV